MGLNGALKAEEFVCHVGSTEYQLAVEPGDCQLDYFLLADGEVQLYISLGDTVLPLAVGSTIRGRVLVKDAKWLLVKTKKTTLVAAQVFQAPRRLIDTNDRVPVAMHVPTAPPVDLRAMVDRLLAQKLEERGEYQVEMTNEDLEDLYPEDVDTEFGPGHVQLEEDDEIEEILHAERARRKAAAAAARKRREGSADPEDRSRRKAPASKDRDREEERREPAPTKKD